MAAFDQPYLLELRKVLLQAGEELGERMVQDARERASEPYPPASEPGTSPHTRSGDLVESINYQVLATEDGVSVTVGTTLEYGAWLEEGTEIMSPRPLWGPLGETWQEKAPEVLDSVIASNYGT